MVWDIHFRDPVVFAGCRAGAGVNGYIASGSFGWENSVPYCSNNGHGIIWHEETAGL